MGKIYLLVILSNLGAVSLVVGFKLPKLVARVQFPHGAFCELSAVSCGCGKAYLRVHESFALESSSLKRLRRARYLLFLCLIQERTDIKIIVLSTTRQDEQSVFSTKNCREMK